MSIIDVEAVVNIISVNQTEDTTSDNEPDLCTAIIHGGSSMDLNISILHDTDDAATYSSRPFLALLPLFLLNAAWTTVLKPIRMMCLSCCQPEAVW